MLRYWLMGAASSALLGAASLNANAAPASAASDMRSAVQQTSQVEKAAYRRCRWRNGVRRCAWVQTDPDAYEDGYYYYGRPRPEAYPTGSTAWWRAMDYEGRGGHGRSR